MKKPAPFTSYKNSLGFSIIEIILVIAVAGAILLVIGNIPSSIGLIGQSKHESIAKEAASQTIENYRNKTYSNLANGSVPLTDSRITQLPGGTGVVVTEDCPIAICPSSETVKKVTVTISWNEKQTPRSVILTTLISDGGLQ